MNKVYSAVKNAVGGKTLRVPYVPIDMYIFSMKEMAERLHQLEQKTNKKSIRKIVEASHQKQEQRLNNLRDECVRMLNLMRDKGMMTQAEINEAARGG